MKIFVGSSSSRESLDLVREIEALLEEQAHEPVPWYTPGLFPPGERKHGELRHPNDLAGLTYIDVSPNRRARGRLELSIWAQKLSTPREIVLSRHGGLIDLNLLTT